MSGQTVELGEMKAIAQLKPIDPLLGRTGLYIFETLNPSHEPCIGWTEPALLE